MWPTRSTHASGGLGDPVLPPYEGGLSRNRTGCRTHETAVDIAAGAVLRLMPLEGHGLQSLSKLRDSGTCDTCDGGVGVRNALRVAMPCGNKGKHESSGLDRRKSKVEVLSTMLDTYVNICKFWLPNSRHVT